MSNDIQISEADIDKFLTVYNASLSVEQTPLEFDEVRRSALTDWNDLQACPGSGKTTLVAVKLMILAQKWRSKYQGICVLTHTNVACDEIKSRLKEDADGCKLLSYPHFIGTIQEFVNKHLALPYIRSSGKISITRVDDEACKEFAEGRVQIRTQNYLDQKRASLYNLKMDRVTGRPNIPAFNKPSESPSYKNMCAILKARLQKGLFCFSEMYLFASRYLQQVSGAKISLQDRFSHLFIDEMQDTQKFQDELINSIFECDDVKIQRFGDPDQAIFDNMGGEEPNETFNENDDLSILAHSHRFSEDVASKVSTLSYSQIGDIQARAAPSFPCPHTVIVYDDDSKQQVLEVFSQVVDEYDTKQNWQCIKAVGATEGAGGHIKAYWEDFVRHNSVSSPKPKKLLDIIGRKWQEHDQGAEKQYKLIVQSLLDLLRIASVVDSRSGAQKYFNVNSLKSWLKENEHYASFREIVTDWILNGVPSNTVWEDQLNKLKEMFDITDGEAVNAYLSYDVGGNVDEVNNPNSNIFCAENGRNIEVGTIHSVKGETHDATLVIETKNHENDIEQLLDYIAGIDNKKVTGKRKIKAMRQLYVAFSRPRHLLCFAVHKDNISNPQREALDNNGWKIKPIYGAENE